MKKYKILILSDLKETIDATLKNAVSLAKMINGEIELFHVKRPVDVVESENQLSSMRTLNRDYISTKNRMDDLIKSYNNNYNMNISYNMTLGNVKNEIERCIEEKQPDIIVIGKRKNKPLKIAGDKITEFIIRKHKGVVMIASKNNVLEPNGELSLGVYENNVETSEHISSSFTENLMAATQKPVKAFKIVKKSNKAEVNNSNSKNTIEYVFEAGDNAISYMSSYVSKNNINLLCIDRSKTESGNKIISRNSEISGIINKLNVSLLLTA